MPPLKTNRYIPTDKDEAFSQIWQEVGDLRTDVEEIEALLDATATTKQIIDMIKPLAREAFSFELPITYDPDKYLIGYRASSINHELLSGLLGGAANDHYHLTAVQVAALHAAVTVSDTVSIDLTITGQALSGVVLPAGVDHAALGNINSASYSHLTTTEIATLRVALEPMGFPNRTDTTLSFSDANKRFTITGTNFAFYVLGVKYVHSTESVDITDTFGLWYIYYNTSGVLTASQTAWGFSTACPVATVYWNGTNGLIGEERHGVTMDWATHQYLHDTVGGRYESGFNLTVTNSASWSIAAGVFHDEDIEHSYTAKTQSRIFYRGASGFTFTAATGNLFYQVSSVLQYNNGTSLADVSAAKFMAMWMFATPDQTTPIALIMGQREDNTVALARANNTYGSLVLGTLPFPEMKLLYRIIIQRNGAGVDYVETEDYRSVSNLSSGTYVATSHSSLTGLTADDHTQYLLADGTRKLVGPFDSVKSASSMLFYISTYSTTDSDNSQLILRKSSSATIGVAGETASGENLGQIIFRGVNAAGTPAFVTAAKILVSQVDAAGAAYVGAKMDFMLATNASAFATKMTLWQDGKLSIGNVAADSLLHVWSASAGTVTAPANTILTIENSGAAYQTFLFGSTSDAGIKWGIDVESSYSEQASIIWDYSELAIVCSVASVESFRFSDTGMISKQLLTAQITPGSALAGEYNALAVKLDPTGATNLAIGDGPTIDFYIPYDDTGAGGRSTWMGARIAATRTSATDTQKYSALKFYVDYNGDAGTLDEFFRISNAGVKAYATLSIDVLTTGTSHHVLNSTTHQINTAGGDQAELKATSLSLATSGGTITLLDTTKLSIAGNQIVGTRGAAIVDASGGGTVDAEARTAINTLLARCRAHGLIAT